MYSIEIFLEKNVNENAFEVVQCLFRGYRH